MLYRNIFNRIDIMPHTAIPDVQSHQDLRHIPIREVGIKGLRHPLSLRQANGEVQHTVADCQLTVALPATQKGTHMSRFVALLHAQDTPLDGAGFEALVRATATRLESDSAHIRLRFPYFLGKTAPASGVASLLDYQVCLDGRLAHGQYQYRLQVTVPVTSRCPCSKQISRYGAHNQRSHICIDAEADNALAVETLIAIAEAQASCQLYGLLKRSDEKVVTEQAYDNPKFVEDLVRDVAEALRQEPLVRHFVVTSENFESIHNHSAYACIDSRDLA